MSNFPITEVTIESSQIKKHMLNGNASSPEAIEEAVKEYQLTKKELWAALKPIRFNSYRNLERYGLSRMEGMILKGKIECILDCLEED